jgi:hypothetical protein
MKKAILFLALTTSLACTAEEVSDIEEPTLQSYIDTKTLPQAINPVGCVSIDTLTNKHTPVDMFAGVVTCIENKDYEQGAKLYLLALTYAEFDSKRVVGLMAAEVVTALKLNTFSSLPENTMTDFRFAVEATLGYADQKSFTCRALNNIGAPKYHPNYMINYGLAHLENNDNSLALLVDFNEKKSWNEVVEKYSKCN